MKTQKTVLVAPLNWGLGHATRCIPIIDELLKQGAAVVLASDGSALQLLKQTYPNLPTVVLPSYGITYKGNNMFLNIAPQLPKIIKAIKLERQKLPSIIEKYQIDAIISDNRYGMYHSTVKSVFMTHQLHIQISQKMLQSIVNRLNHQFIQKFDSCWVPDWTEKITLAGILAHPPIETTVAYTGPLSRFAGYKRQQLKKQYDVIVVLSGPEPQRSILEQKIVQQAKGLPLKFLVVGGKLTETSVLNIVVESGNVERKSFLAATELAHAIQESSIVVARSGYSTLMDLIALQCRKVLLIPTPGQTEQMYLATYFEQHFGYTTTTQQQLKLEQDLATTRAATLNFEELPDFGCKLVGLVEGLLKQH